MVVSQITRRHFFANTGVRFLMFSNKKTHANLACGSRHSLAVVGVARRPLCRQQQSHCCTASYKMIPAPGPQPVEVVFVPSRVLLLVFNQLRCSISYGIQSSAARDHLLYSIRCPGLLSGLVIGVGRRGWSSRLVVEAGRRGWPPGLIVGATRWGYLSGLLVEAGRPC